VSSSESIHGHSHAYPAQAKVDLKVGAERSGATLVDGDARAL
jgi:hypothetical protein